MHFSDLKKTIIAQFMAPNGHQIVPFIEGRPGGGKSACAREIADVLKETFKISDEQVVEFNPSLRDPVDIMGIPFRHDSGLFNEWLPPEEFYRLRHGVGPCVLIIEELSDAPMPMQNPLCRIIFDRYAGSLKLSDQLYIIATGNRVEDRSGANRLSTKLGNRIRCLNFEENLDDWVIWAKSHNIDDILIKFLQFQPKLLSDFDPKRKTNPTPRAWEKVSYTPEFQDDDGSLYLEHITGDVGEGAAVTYAAFRKIYKSLPDMKALLNNPSGYKVPKDNSLLWATVMKLTSIVEEKTTTQSDVDAICIYLTRVPKELQAVAMREMLTGKGRIRLVSSPGMLELAESLNLTTLGY